jgi:antitoxin YefM
MPYERFDKLVHNGGTVSISASEARQRLFPLLEQVNTDHEPMRITSKAGDAVLMLAADCDSWQETVYLLRSPETRPTAPLPGEHKKSIDELQEMAGGEE